VALKGHWVFLLLSSLGIIRSLSCVCVILCAEGAFRWFIKPSYRIYATTWALRWQIFRSAPNVDSDIIDCRGRVVSGPSMLNGPLPLSTLNRPQIVLTDSAKLCWQSAMREECHNTGY
jgi:hypothetical protein